VLFRSVRPLQAMWHRVRLPVARALSRAMQAPRQLLEV